jgi:hypothetical protein
MSNELSINHEAWNPMDMCRTVALSGIGGIKTPEAAFALTCLALSEDPSAGDSPVAFMRALGKASRSYNIIDGKPSMKAEEMLGRFQNAGGTTKVLAYTDLECKMEFSHPRGGSCVIEWTKARAQNIGLMKKDNWIKHTRAMLRSRCISEGIRTVFPVVLGGMYTPEEIKEIVAESVATTPEPPKVTKQDAQAVYARLSVLSPDKAKELAKAHANDPAGFCEAAEAEIREYSAPIAEEIAEQPAEETTQKEVTG